MVIILLLLLYYYYLSPDKLGKSKNSAANHNEKHTVKAEVIVLKIKNVCVE